jgi:peptidoglycan/xylan/chitin deacetylase (PgdA/CDA1 family)
MFSFLAVTLAINCNNTTTPQNSTKADSAAAVTAAPDTVKKVVKFESAPIVIDTNKRYIFLTWDDGPQPPGSTNCFNIFRQLGVKASFFTIANHVEGRERQNLIDTIRSSYPQYLLVNHSKSHAFNDHYQYFYHHPHDALLDFIACQQQLAIPFKIVRLPGNSAWVRTGEVAAAPLVKPVCLLLDSAGYNVIGWDEEWGFKTVNHESVPVQGAQTMARMIDRDFTEHHLHSRNTLVLLAHDRMFAHANYADSLYKCLSILKKDPRYVFETIDHYPGLKRGNN